MIVFLVVFFNSALPFHMGGPMSYNVKDTARAACLALETEWLAGAALQAKVDRRTGLMVWTKPLNCKITVETK